VQPLPQKPQGLEPSPFQSIEITFHSSRVSHTRFDARYSEKCRYIMRYSIAVLAFFASPLIHAQGVGNSASIAGTVLDPAGAVVPNAAVEIHNPISGLSRSTTTD